MLNEIESRGVSSLGRSILHMEQTGLTDPWVDVSLADYLFLTVDRSGRAHAYEAALGGNLRSSANRSARSS